MELLIQPFDLGEFIMQGDVNNGCYNGCNVNCQTTCNTNCAEGCNPEI
jgi:hypothetical protein